MYLYQEEGMIRYLSKYPSQASGSNAPAMLYNTKVYPHRKTYKIRNFRRYTTWYGPTRSERKICTPPEGLSPARGWLYVHRHAKGEQIWMYIAPRRTRSSFGILPARASGSGSGSGTGTLKDDDEYEEEEEHESWRRVYVGDPHPDLRATCCTSWRTARPVGDEEFSADVRVEATPR
ncbi:hypothetical protein BV20DRAFT_1119816 [Pilatotrama ljubarskyi]|nr:hypothetical protein BV20DRAFT_1119816 [Pilatotrama ljubarskyi]